MADFGWSMPMGAEEAKNRQDRKDADWDEALKDEAEAQLETLNKNLDGCDKDAIQAVADQLCPVKIVEIMRSTPNRKHVLIMVEKEYSQAKSDAAEIMAIKKLERQ